MINTIRHHLPSTILFLLILLCVSLFGQAQNENDKYHKQAYKDPYKIMLKIKESVNDIVKGEPVEIAGEYVFSSKVLPKFYANRDYMPAWSNFKSLEDALFAIQGAYRDGLLPEDYHADALESLVNKIEHKLDEETIDYDWIAEFDILMTDAILMYAYHLTKGKIDPVSLDHNWNYSFRDISPEAPYSLEKSIVTSTVSKTLESLRPNNPAYEMYIELLALYRTIAEKGGWGAIPSGGVIKPGQEDERIPLIRKRLNVTAELYATTDLNSIVYDSLLELDITRFQKRNALTPDGIIGKGTIDALNISVEDKINTIKVNMERDRWVMGNLTDEFILVNIPAFKAYYMKDHQFVYSTNVQVGKTYHQTPVFKERLRYIEFNPTWTVPVSIVRSSILPKMKDDQAYLDGHHFELLDGSGNVVSNSSVDYERISASYFPYTVRQKPGPWNALGVVKFIFPNQHSVYLHDTPSKSLFAQQDRAFSHGCIRTENPLDLAEVLLKGTKWDRTKIDKVVESRVTTRAYFDREVEVLLLYWTAGYYDGDGIGFFKDVYNRDAKILELLNKKDNRRPEKVDI